MKAIAWTAYGAPDVLHLAEAAKPVPAENEVLIRVHATTATTADAMMRKGESRLGRLVMGLVRPRRKFRVPGLELAGEIESVGKKVTRFKPGDQVFGFTGFRLGAYAEYTCLPETGSLAIKPANTTYEEAATAVDGASTALFFLSKADVHSGQEVLIYGASGSIGTYAIQLAKHFGATVTAVCSAANAELVTSLGADRVIDYTTQDFTKTGDTYDVIFDTVGKTTFSRCKSALKPRGRYLVTVMGLVPVLQTLWTRMTGGKRVIFAMSIEKAQALTVVKGLIETGKIRPVIDKRFPLEQIAEAHRYVDTGRKRGNVAITVGRSDLT